MCEMVCRFCSLMKFLRAKKSVQLWINLDANTPNYKRHISRTIASVLMRRRSLQLLSRLRRFRSFPRFSAVWAFDANSRMLQSTNHPEFLGISTIAAAPNHDSDQEEFSCRAVITSTTTASASARSSPECDDCQKTANFFSGLSIGKLSQKL